VTPFTHPLHIGSVKRADRGLPRKQPQRAAGSSIGLAGDRVVGLGGSREQAKASRTPRLKDTIPGIEAYLSLGFYRAAESELGPELISPSNSATAGWELGVEKSELGKRKHDIHQLLKKRVDPTDIAPVIALVPWISKLVTSAGQTTLSI